jgi:membrane protease YdiL (CAAX protease family)
LPILPEASQDEVQAERPEVSPLPAPRPLPDPWVYLATVFILYAVMGSIAQEHQLPLGLWLSQYGFFFVPTVLLLWARGFRPWRFLGLDRLPPARQIPLVIGISVFVFLAAGALMAVLEILAPENWADRFDVSHVLDSVNGPWRTVLFAAVILGAPIAEETVFRGYLFPAFRQRMGLRPALFLQAALFSFIHLDPVGFAPRFLLGVVLGELSLFTGSLWASIFAHALNNGVSSLLYFALGPGPQAQVGTTDLTFAASLAALATVVAFAMLSVLRSRAVGDLLPQYDAGNIRAAPSPQRTKAAAWTWVTLVLLGLWGIQILPAR